MKAYKAEISSGSSSKMPTSPSTPLFKKQRRLIDESPLSQSEISWANDSEFSPQRQVSVRAKSSNQLVQTPVRVVKRHVSSPSIGTIKVKNLFDYNQTLELDDEEATVKKDSSFSISSDEFDFSDDQLIAVLKKVDEEEQLEKKINQNKLSQARPAFSSTNFEDSFDDAILASIPLEELSKCTRSNIEIVYNDGMSQILNKNSPGLSKNKSVELKVEPNHIVTKRSFERHNSLPQQPLANSTNVINATPAATTRQCTKEEIEEKRKAAQQRYAQRMMKKR